MKHTSEWIHPGFETQGRCHHNRVISGSTKMTDVLQKKIKNKNNPPPTRMHSSRMRTTNSLLYGGLPDRDPYGQRPPPGQRLHQTETHPRQRPLWTEPSPLWTDTPFPCEHTNTCENITFTIFLWVVIKLNKKCIPIGCVLPIYNCMGVSLTETSPRTETPPGQIHPLGRDLTLDRDPPVNRMTHRCKKITFP